MINSNKRSPGWKGSSNKRNNSGTVSAIDSPLKTGPTFSGVLNYSKLSINYGSKMHQHHLSLSQVRECPSTKLRSNFLTIKAKTKTNDSFEFTFEATWWTSWVDDASGVWGFTKRAWGQICLNASIDESTGTKQPNCRGKSLITLVCSNMAIRFLR